MFLLVHYVHYVHYVHDDSDLSHSCLWVQCMKVGKDAAVGAVLTSDRWIGTDAADAAVD